MTEQKLTAKEESVLELITKDKIVANYFLKKAKDPKWLPYLKERGFFSPEKAPGPEPADEEGFYTIPYWNVLDYLERVSPEVRKPGNEVYIDKLLEIIKEVTEYHKQTKKLDNYHIWSSFIRIISNLPNEKFTEEIIDLIPIWLDSRFDTELQSMEIIKKLFPKLLHSDNPEDIKKAEKIISYLTGIKKKEDRKVLVVNSFWLKEFFKKHLKDIAEKCSTENIACLFVKRIRKIASNEYEGTLESLYEYEDAEYLLEKPVELLSYALGKILLINAKKEPQDTAKVLKSILEEKLPIFTKIALFILGQNLSQKDFKDIFWKAIKGKGVDIFRGASIYWGDELKKVLENLGPLDDEQRKLLKEKVEEAANKYKYIESLKKEDEKEKQKAFFKQRIYNALAYDEKFRSLYEEMKKITKTDAELHPVIGKVEVKTRWGKPPLSVEEILKMDNTKLGEYLMQFNDFWKTEDLSEAIRTAVKTEPGKFTKDLKVFLNVGYLYIVKFLEGLKEAITEDKLIAYEEVFDFVEKYINRDEFWQDKFVVKSSLNTTHEWVIYYFCFFIEKILQTETFPIEQFFEKIKNIIHLMMERIKVKKAEEISDYVLYSINTPIGRLIETYIKLVLRILQSSYDKKDPAIKDFVKKFKELLNESIIEAYTLFGMYFLNFYFHIDKNFSVETVKSLKKKDETWEAFMKGYCYVRNIYKEVYELMKEHYETSLEYNFKSEAVKEGIVGHISIGYLVGLENLEPSSLFYKLVKKFDPDDVNQIIHVLWNQRDYLKKDDEKNEQIKNRILDFWKFVYEKLKDKKEEELSEEEQEILFNLVELTCFLPELKEPYTEWLKKSAKFIKGPGTFHSLLEELERLREIGDRVKVAKNIGEILLSIKQLFPYPKNKIEAFIKYLCDTPDHEVKKIAKDICETYLKNGIYDFKEVCEECVDGSNF